MSAHVITLRVALQEWTDWDAAAYSVGVALGILNPETSPFSTKAKQVFWSANAVGAGLHDILQSLVSLGVLLRRGEPDDQYRWNPAFRGSWE